MSIKTLAGISAAAILSILAGNAYGELAEGLKATKSQGFDNTNAVSAILGGTALGYSGSAGAYVKVGNNDTNYATTLGGGGMYSGDQLVDPTSNWSILAVAKLKAGLENGAIYGIGRYNAVGSCHKGLALIQKDGGTVKLVHWAAVNGANNDTITTILDDVAVPYGDLQYHSYLVTHAYTAAVADPATPARSTYTLYIDGVEKKTATIDALEIDANGYQMGNVHGAIPEGLNYGTGILLDEVGVWTSDVGQTGATALATELPAYPTISVADVTITEATTWAELIAATPNADTINITVEGSQTLTFGDATSAGNIIVKSGELIIADNSNLTADRITINSGATLTITEGSLTASKVDNSGTIKIDGGTAETPVIITEDGGTDSGIGQVVLTSGSVLKDDVTGSGNKKYTITGADDHTSKLILNSNHNWGMPSDARLRNLTVEITGADFWIEHAAQIDSTVDIVTDKIIHFQNNNFTLGTLSGSGNHARNGQNTVTLTMTSNSTYTGTSSIPFILSGTHGLTLNEGNTTPIDAAAKIGNTYYATLSAAKNVMVEGEKVIEVVKDVEIGNNDVNGYTLLIPSGKTVTATATPMPWSNANSKIIVKGTLTVNGGKVSVENSKLEIYGGATINGSTTDQEGIVSIAQFSALTLHIEEGETITLDGKVTIRQNGTFDVPADATIAIKGMIPEYWGSHTGGVVTKTGAGALTIGEFGIGQNVSVALNAGTLVVANSAPVTGSIAATAYAEISDGSKVYTISGLACTQYEQGWAGKLVFTGTNVTGANNFGLDSSIYGSATEIEIATGAVVHGYFPQSASKTVPLTINGTFDIVNGFSGANQKCTIPTLKGSGTISKNWDPNPNVYVEEHGEWTGTAPACVHLSVAKAGSTYYYTVADVIAAIGNGTTIDSHSITAEQLSGTGYKLEGGNIVALANYTITVEVENATVAGLPESMTVREDDAEISFTVTPDEGYVVTSVKIGDTALEAGEDGTYTTTLEGNATITVTTELDVPPVPTALVTDADAGELDAAYTFTTNANETEATTTYYGNWLADFEVTFDSAIAADTVKLAGKYAVPEGMQVGYDGSWVSFKLGEYETTDDPIMLVGQFGLDLTYAMVRQIGEFGCGVKNLSADNIGKEMTVKLVLTNPETFESITISTTKYPIVKYTPEAPTSWDDITDDDVTTLITLPEGQDETVITAEALQNWADKTGATFGEAIPVNALILNCAPDAVILNDVKAAADEILEDYLEEATKEVDLATLLKEIPADGKEISIEGYPMATIKLVPATLGEGVTTSANLFKLELKLK